MHSRTFYFFHFLLSLNFLGISFNFLLLLLQLLPSLTRFSLSIQQSSTSAPSIPHRSRKCRTLILTQHVTLLLPREHLVISTQSDFQKSSLQPLLITASGTDHSKHYLTSFIIFIILTIFITPTIFPSLKIQNSPHLPCLSHLLIFLRLSKYKLFPPSSIILTIPAPCCCSTAFAPLTDCSSSLCITVAHTGHHTYTDRTPRTSSTCFFFLLMIQSFKFFVHATIKQSLRRSDFS